MKNLFIIMIKSYQKFIHYNNMNKNLGYLIKRVNEIPTLKI